MLHSVVLVTVVGVDVAANSDLVFCERLLYTDTCTDTDAYTNRYICTENCEHGKPSLGGLYF